MNPTFTREVAVIEVKPSTVAHWALAFVFLYHGLVPKLLFVHPSEVALVAAGPATGVAPELLVMLAGMAEVLWAAVIVVAWRARWPLYASAVALIGLFLGAAGLAPATLIAAFNPVSLTVVSLALVWIALQAE